MILITKEESVKLNKMGYSFGEDLHKSCSRHPKYYLTETNRALNDLSNLRTKNIVCSRDK